MEPAITGTVSHGTLRSDDLIPAFLGALEVIAPDAVNLPALRDEAAILLKAGGKRRDPDETDWFIDSVMAAINDALPEGWYFGTIEGDGSDFGVWEVEDA